MSTDIVLGDSLLQSTEDKYSASALTNDLRTADLLLTCGPRKVFDLGHAILKLGRRAHMLREFSNLQLAREICPEVASLIPMVLAVHVVVGNSDRIAVTMEKKPGVPLSDCLDELDIYDLTNIAGQVAAFVANLRAHVGDWLGPMQPGLGFDDPIFDPPVGRPLDTVSEFHEYWKLRFRAIARDKDVRSIETVPIPSPAEAERAPVLTHGDLAARNILVEDGEVTGIIDWECAGYHPYFWESVRMLWDQQAGEKWQRLMPSLLPQYYREYLVYRFILASVCQ